MDLVLLIDFGSTYTKVAVVDLDEARLVGWAQADSTVKEDIMIGLNRALGQLKVDGRPVTELKIEKKLACSSAAGGLQLVSVGLVPSLTVEAATRAALGAGAKVVGAYSYELTEGDLARIEQRPCDMVLLAGGTDGGEKKTILHNAGMLARIKRGFPIVVAGNRAASDEVRDILSAAGKEVIITENVLPTLDNINVEPSRSAIREIFMKRIIHAKGIDKAKQYVSDVVMPTPMSVLKAAQLLAQGTENEAGLGELVVVDVGGATTDVCSLASGQPTRSGVIVKGLPEPYAKRTVEGDLGIRYNARTILEIAGKKTLVANLPPSDLDMGKMDWKEITGHLSHHVEFVPETEKDLLVDAALAYTAAEVAMERHAGLIRQVYLPAGTVDLQYGKDLTGIKTVIGTGGVFVHNHHSRRILEAAVLNRQKNPFLLKPETPHLYVDGDYILFAVGLLSEIAPTPALRIAKKALRAVGPNPPYS